jgi:DNA invertase Pin-like site-specific DNA recombinase
MQRAFSYLRVSGKDQVRGDGFPRQRSAIKAFAAKHAYRIVREFREEGVSGAIETMDRPAWSEMMTELHSDGVRTIIVEKLDRLARDLMVQEACIADLRKNGFTLVSVAEPDLMESDPTRVLMRHYEGEQAAIDRMKTLRASGMGFDRIEAALNAEGFQTRTGKRWHGLVVNRILTGKARTA